MIVAFLIELSDAFVKSRKECGRPLGLRLKGNYLYVADAFNGIFKYDLDKSLLNLFKELF
jgi:hypothetical protein